MTWPHHKHHEFERDALFFRPEKCDKCRASGRFDGPYTDEDGDSVFWCRQEIPCPFCGGRGIDTDRHASEPEITFGVLRSTVCHICQGRHVVECGNKAVAHTKFTVKL